MFIATVLLTTFALFAPAPDLNLDGTPDSITPAQVQHVDTYDIRESY